MKVSFMKVPVKTAGFAALFISLSLFCTAAAQARNEAVFFSIQDAIKSDETNSKIRDDVRFYFGNQPYSAVEAVLSQRYVAYKKGSILDSTELEACNKTFLAALAQFQEHARRLGGNAVTNIESFYKKISFKSNDKYECHAGRSRTGVVLRGDIVRLNK